MKKLIATSLGIITIAGFTSLALFNQPTQEIAIVEVSNVGISAPETVLKPLEAPLVQEVSTEPISTVEVKVDASEPVKVQAPGYKEVTDYIRSLTNENTYLDIFSTYIQNREAFDKDYKLAVDTCVKVYSDYPKLTSSQYRAIMSNHTKSL